MQMPQDGGYSIVYVQDWRDMHCGAFYCNLGLPTLGLSRISRLAVTSEQAMSAIVGAPMHVWAVPKVKASMQMFS